MQMEDFVTQFLTAELTKSQGLRVYPIIHVLYEKQFGDESILSLMPMAATSFNIKNQFEIPQHLPTISNEFRRNNETLLRNQSFSNLVHVDRLELHLAHTNPLDPDGGTHQELTTFLEGKRCITNILNTDNRCFSYSFLAAMFPVDHTRNPERPYRYNDPF